MRGERVLLVTGAFWPLVGGDVSRAISLEGEFRRRGAEVEILTARHHSAWPAEITFRETPVVRIGPSPHTRIGRLRYLHGMRQWLRRRHGDFSVIYCLGGDDEIACVLRALKPAPERPIVVAPAETLRRASRLIARRAAAVIAPCEHSAQELLDAGIDAARLAIIGHGVEIRHEAAAAERREARASLAEIHPAMALGEGAPLAVYVGALRRENRLGDFVDAWSYVVHGAPHARLWMVGEGPDGHSLFRRLKRQELVDQALLVGAFDDLTEIWRAADIALLPSSGACPGRASLEAMAADVPVVALADRAQGVEAWRRRMIMVPSRKPDALGEAILRIFEDAARRRELAREGRRFVEEYSIERCGQAHEDLFARLREPRGLEARATWHGLPARGKQSEADGSK